MKGSLMILMEENETPGGRQALSPAATAEHLRAVSMCRKGARNRGLHGIAGKSNIDIIT